LETLLATCAMLAVGVAVAWYGLAVWQVAWHWPVGAALAAGGGAYWLLTGPLRFLLKAATWTLMVLVWALLALILLGGLWVLVHLANR
jgi:hypothetical protein